MSGWRSAQREDGQSIILVIMAMFVLLGFVGIALDVGFGLLQKRRLQASVDLALLSGARELPDASAAATEAESFARENFARVSDLDINVATDTSCMEDGCPVDDRISLEASTQTPTFFLSLFGVDNWDVSARGAACGPCDSSPFAYDVVVILDRSYSMCTNGSGGSNGCSDLANARAGIRELLGFFDPDTDRISLAVLSSADTNSCSGLTACPTSSTYGRPYSHTTPGSAFTWTTNTAATSPYCTDSANPNHAYYGENGRYYRSAGDFMDGSPSNHDRWVLVSLAQGTNFKNADGTLNENSMFLDTLDCLKHKYWTPIAPAIFEATEELRTNGRSEDDDGNPVTKVIVFFGDGGGNAQPMRRQNNGTPYSSTYSWYTPTSGNNNRPCHDAVGQADRARSYGIQVYTIGYALGEGSASTCGTNSGGTESGINAEQTMREMADTDDKFFEQVSAGDVRDIFQAIGHNIVSGGTRLVE